MKKGSDFQINGDSHQLGIADKTYRKRKNHPNYSVRKKADFFAKTWQFSFLALDKVRIKLLEKPLAFSGKGCYSITVLLELIQLIQFFEL